MKTTIVYTVKRSVSLWSSVLPILSTLFFVCVSVSVKAWDGATDANAWQQLQSQVQTKRNQLKGVYDQAKAAGHDVARAQVSLDTIDVFMDVTEWDFNNPTIMADYITKWPISQFYTGDDYKKIPFEQLEDCIDIANFAIAELNQQLQNKIKLSDSVDLFTAHKTVVDGVYMQDGKAVFPYTVIGNGLTDKRQSFGSHGGSYHYLNHLLSDLKPVNWIKNQAVTRLQTTNQEYLTPFVQFHGHAGALRDWMLDGPYDIVETYSPRKIYNGGRNFVNYDINNPHIQSWLGSLNTTMALEIKLANEASGGKPIIHMLANEPHFSIRENGWRVTEGGFTDYMREGFKTWLKNKYGTIANLNMVHRKNYANFDAYSFSFPVAESLQGTPEYFELVNYNLDRVNHFFTTQANTVKAQDPSAEINIKLLGGTLVSNMAGGIDFEYLTNLMDVTGSDFESTPQTAEFVGESHDRIANDGWLGHYSFYWSIGTQFIDYAKSLRPHAPHYNSEWHGFDTGAWRDFNMSRDYVNAAFWTHHAHGLNLTDAWAWLREADGKIKEAGAIGGLTTLPIALDQFGRTMKDINNHGDAIAAVAAQERFAHVYMSRDSAIQDNNMNKDGQVVYEALKLLNYAVGVVTKNTINSLDPSKDFIVMPPTQYLALQEINRLNNFQTAGGRVIAYERSGEPFAMKTEYGFNRSSALITPYRTLAYSNNPMTMADELDGLTNDLVPEVTIPYEVYNGQNLARRGVLIRQSLNASTGHVDIFMVNVSKHYLNVDFDKTEAGRSWDYFDQVNGIESERKIWLKPMGVRLLKATPNHGSTNPSETVNLALNKAASQSSSYNNNFPASKAVDGRSTGQAGDFNHTLNDANGWWQVDLGEVSTINNIQIYNRTNCCSNRLSNFHVLVSDVPFSSTNLNSTINQTGVGNFHITGEAGSPTSINVNRTGRYVRVQLAGTNYLHLSEVVVNGTQGTSGGNPAPASIFTLQAEDFNATGGPYQGFNKYTVGSEGGINFNQRGDWADYVIDVPQAGNYKLEAYTGTTQTDGAILISAGNATLKQAIPNNGNWDSFVKVTSSGTIALNAGVQTIRVMSDGTTASTWEWNADKFVFIKQ